MKCSTSKGMSSIRALAQGQHLNRHYIQSVVEILAKLSFGHKRVQIAMRGHQHSHVASTLCGFGVLS
jgi:hypothetical protein